MSKYIRTCDWCTEELVGIEDHTDKEYICSNSKCPHDHGGYIRCNDVDACRKRACKFGGNMNFLNNIEARRFVNSNKK